MNKRYLAELVGTFIIVFFPVALSGSGGFDGSSLSLLAAAIASGLPVIAAIYALGCISGAHLNPAVTLAFTCAKRFPARFVVPYLLAQFAGAILACAVASMLFGQGHGVHVPADSSQIVRNLGTEVVITFVLMLVIMAVATDDRVHSVVPALAIGAAVILGVIIGGPITGGSMNPARSLAPALFGKTSTLSHYWLYFVGPCVGAILGALTFEAMRLDPSHQKNVPGGIE